MGVPRGSVGILWSTVATVRAACRTFLPAARNPSKACGEVTSCTRCRSIYKIGDRPAGSATRWAFQIFSNNVRAVAVDVIEVNSFSQIARCQQDVTPPNVRVARTEWPGSRPAHSMFLEECVK